MFYGCWPRPGIIGNQPALDVEAVLRQQQQRQVDTVCRSPVQENRKSSPTGSETSGQSSQVTALAARLLTPHFTVAQVTPSRQLSDTEKMRKVVVELVETERTYVKVSKY